MGCQDTSATSGRQCLLLLGICLWKIKYSNISYYFKMMTFYLEVFLVLYCTSNISTRTCFAAWACLATKIVTHNPPVNLSINTEKLVVTPNMYIQLQVYNDDLAFNNAAVDISFRSASFN